MDKRGRHGNHRRGAAHPRWSEDRMISEHGYAKLRVGKGHPLADPNGYAYEHEVVWVSAGMPLPERGSLLHHKDETKTDNRIENLEVKSRSEHGLYHQPTSLLDEEVVALREAFKAGDHTGILAKRFGISIQTAWKIVRGIARKTAGGPVHKEPIRKRRAGRLLDGKFHDAHPSEESP